MEQEHRKTDETFTEEDSSFDIIGWLVKILHYWYLFVISIGICLGLAYLKNKSWKPIYKTSARIILGENETGISSPDYNFMQGFGGNNMRNMNMNNQLILFSSRDIISRTISQLDFTVDYYTKGRFKTNYLYKISPVEIVNYEVFSVGYGLEFVIIPQNENVFQLKYEDNSGASSFTLQGLYGIPLETSFFKLTVQKNSDYSQPIYFKFRNPLNLENDFSGRLALDFYKERSTVLEISLVGENPGRDEDFINELCLQYQAFSLERKNDAAIKTIDFIDNQLAALSDSLMNTEEKMRAFRAESGIIDLSAYAGQLIGKGSEIESALTALKLKEDYLNYLTDYLESNIQDNTIMTPSGFGINDPVLITLVNELMKIDEKMAQIGEKNPYYNIYNQQRKEIKVRMSEVLTNMRATLNIEKRALLDRQKEVGTGIVTLTDKERIIQNIQRHYQINENYYNFLLQKRADAQIKKASNSPDNIILDKASVNGIINVGTKGNVYYSYLLIGLIIPFIFVILRTLLDNTIKTKRDIEKITPYPIIGTSTKTLNKENLPVLNYPQSLFTERFREIRTRIEFVAKKGKGISILVTSTEPGDGKTFVSANLAAIYGYTTGRTLLIDMDFRRPSVCRLLDIHADKGISNYLIGQVSLDDIIVSSSVYNFDVLPSGTIPPNPGELIKMEKLHQMIEYLKQQYDYIIIDTSPIGLVSDAYTINGMVDLMMFIVRYSKTSKKFFKNTITQIRKDGLNSVNIIFNDADDFGGYGYGRDSRYYGLWKKNYYTNRAGYYAGEYFHEENNLRRFNKKKNNN
jgi:capsular exopolysaccharide synthesis family protein